MPFNTDMLKASKEAAKKAAKEAAKQIEAAKEAAKKLTDAKKLADAEADAKAFLEETKEWATRKPKKVVPTTGLLKITNHMRAPWIVPAEILPGKTKGDVSKIEMRHSYFKYQQKIAMPNATVIVDKYAFNRYCRASRAFQAMIDLKHLAVSDITLPEAMLTSIAPAIPPPDLTKQANVAMHVEGDTGSIMDKMPKVAVLNK